MSIRVAGRTPVRTTRCASTLSATSRTALAESCSADKPRAGISSDAGVALRSCRQAGRTKNAASGSYQLEPARTLALRWDQMLRVSRVRITAACDLCGHLRRERPRHWKPAHRFPSRVRHRRRRPRLPVAEPPRLHRPWRVIGFKAFLRRRVRNVPDRFRWWDVLSFHGLRSPSRPSSLARRRSVRCCHGRTPRRWSAMAAIGVPPLFRGAARVGASLGRFPCVCGRRPDCSARRSRPLLWTSASEVSSFGSERVFRVCPRRESRSPPLAPPDRPLRADLASERFSR
jgi:hypothetical protein